MGGGMDSAAALMEWELVSDERKPPSSAASSTSEPTPNNALVLEYLSNLDIDILPRTGEVSNEVRTQDNEIRTQDNEVRTQLRVALPSPPLSHSEVVPSEQGMPAEQMEREQQPDICSEEEAVQQTENVPAEPDCFPLTESNKPLTEANKPFDDWSPLPVEDPEPNKPPEKEVVLEEDIVAVLRKVTELAVLQRSLPQGEQESAALAVLKLLQRLEELAGGPWEGLKTVHAALADKDNQNGDASSVLKELEGFFTKVVEALRLPEVRVQLTKAEEKAREKRKKRMHLLGMVGGMSALLFVGAGAAVLAAEASLASAYTAYNIFFNPTAISAASAAVDAASGVASLCGLGAVVPGATAASLGVLDLLKAHTRPIRVDQVARLRMIDCMLEQLAETGDASYMSAEADHLKASALRKWRELDLAALSDDEVVRKLTGVRAGRCSRLCDFANTNLTSASILSLVQHTRLLDLVDQLEVLVWHTCFVGIIGPQNAGKSTLIKAMANTLGRTDVSVSDIGLKSHTRSVGAFQLTDTLWVLDCPGSDSISDELAEAWAKFRSLPSFFVLVLHYGNGITREIAALYQQVRARFPDTRIVILVNQVDRYWDDLEEDGVEESRLHLQEVFEQVVREDVDVRFSVLNEKRFTFEMLGNGVLGSEGACHRILQTAEEMSRVFADE